MSFLFEKLEVYQRSLQFLKTTNLLCQRLKGSVYHSLLDQLTRASASIPLNIAEGNGRWHKGEKRQFLRIARGSVFEIVPIVQSIHQLGHINQSEYNQLYEDLQILSRMLMNLIKAVDKINKA